MADEVPVAECSTGSAVGGEEVTLHSIGLKERCHGRNDDRKRNGEEKRPRESSIPKSTDDPEDRNAGDAHGQSAESEPDVRRGECRNDSEKQICDQQDVEEHQ